MSGLFSLTEYVQKLLAPGTVSMKVMWSRELLSLWVAAFAGDLGAAVSEEVTLFAKVAKFVGMSWFPTIPCHQLMQHCA